MLVAKFVVSGNFDTSSAEGKHAINWVKALGEELAKVCYSTVPVKTGNLRSSMYLSPNSRGGFELFYLAPYAYSVHEGAAREPDFQEIIAQKLGDIEEDFLMETLLLYENIQKFIKQDINQ